MALTAEPLLCYSSKGSGDPLAANADLKGTGSLRVDLLYIFFIMEIFIFPLWFITDYEYNFLYYSVGLCCLSSLYIIVCIC